MRLAGIRGAIRGRHETTTTRRDHAAPRHPDLVGRAWEAPESVDELWVADFAYVWTLAGFVYVAFVVDVYSRRILGWRISGSMRTQLVLDAFHQAFQVRHRGDATWGSTSAGKQLVHHSDAGSQYTSVAFTAELLQAGIAGSIGTVGDALDNALCESTHRTVQDRGRTGSTSRIRSSHAQPTAERSTRTRATATAGPTPARAHTSTRSRTTRGLNDITRSSATASPRSALTVDR